MITRDQIRAAISDAYYDARNNGRTMETAADAATDAVLHLIDQTAPVAVADTPERTTP